MFTELETAMHEPDGQEQRTADAAERYALDCEMDELLTDEADTDYGAEERS